MARNIFKISTLALLACTGLANAGGFSRGTTDTDILFEEGNFNIRAGSTFVSPTRKYSTNLNPALVGTSYTDSYVIFSGAVKLNVSDDLRCAATYTNPFGGDTSYVAPTPGLGKLSESLAVNEMGINCGYKFDLAKGRAWILGGIAHNDINYKLKAGAGLLNFDLSGQAMSYKIGAAYEIPEIALRAQVLYTSGFGIDVRGLTNGLAFLPATGAGEAPASLDIRLQSGVAPGWLVFGGVKWTDWSVNRQLILTSAALPGGQSANNYFWKDGWTANVGVGHAFNEQWSGAASITWDRGVKTGFDLSSDTWTLGAGAAYKDSMGGELKFGGGLTYIASAAETKYGALNTAVSSGWAYAVGASYKTKW